MKECGFIDFDPWCGLKIGDNIFGFLTVARKDSFNSDEILALKSINYIY